MPLQSMAEIMPPRCQEAEQAKAWSPAAKLGFVIVLVGLLVVNIFTAMRQSEFASLPKPTSDGPVYENIAYHLSAGHGFWIDWHDPQWRTLYEHSPRSDEYQTYLDAAPQSMPMTGRPPLFPMLIALIYSVIGRGDFAFACVRLISAMFIAIACSMAVANAMSVLFRANSNGQVLGRWSIACGCAGATLLAASNRTLISYAHDFLTEPMALLLTQLLVTMLLALISKRQSASTKPHSGWFLLALALILAAMILARSLFVLWLPAIWILLIMIAGDRRDWRLATQVLMLTLFFMSPWWVRNCVVLERFMPLGTQGPITMLGGYCDEAIAAGGDWQHAPEQRLRLRMQSDPVFIAQSTDVARELMIADEAKRLVRAWIADHVWDLPKLFVSRVVTHWNPYTGKSLVWRLLIVAGAVYLLVQRRPEAWVLVGLPVMNTILVASMYTTGGRFLVPLYGILFTLSAVGISAIAESVFKAANLFKAANFREPTST